MGNADSIQVARIVLQTLHVLLIQGRALAKCIAKQTHTNDHADYMVSCFTLPLCEGWLAEPTSRYPLIELPSTVTYASDLQSMRSQVSVAASRILQFKTGGGVWVGLLRSVGGGVWVGLLRSVSAKHHSVCVA